MKGMSAQVFQAAICLASNGKVVEVKEAKQGWWIAQALRLRRLEVTPSQAAQMGEWIARQGWMAPGLNIEMVLRNWDSWLVRAQNEGTTPAATNTLQDSP